jgi:hypothetical protein
VHRKLAGGAAVAEGAEAAEGDRYQLFQGGTMERVLQTVGNLALADPPCDPSAKGTSDAKEILQSNRLFACLEGIPANPNKLAQHSALRHSAKLVAQKFHLGRPHAWQLFYCMLQHFICPPIFIAKCLSLVGQWDRKWSRDPDFAREWKAACQSNGFDGRLAAAFMNMAPHHDSNYVTNYFKRVQAAHVFAGVTYDPERCQAEVELLRQFSDEVKNSPPTRSTVSILVKAKNPRTGTLGKIKGMGLFVYPQIITGIFLWALEKIPSWRAAECPILDKGKRHYKEGGDAAQEQDFDNDDDDDDPTLTHWLRQHLKEVRSLEAVNRALIIVAHLEGTNGGAAENGGCEGTRIKEVLDALVRGMESFNLLPTTTSHPYEPDYNLWWKEYGTEAEWKVVPSHKIQEVLRVFCD